MSAFATDVAVVGGCGHVGLPLAVAMAACGAVTAIYDTNVAAVDAVNAGVMPFREEGAAELLADAVRARLLSAAADPSVVASAEHIVVVLGTPVDEHLNPDPLSIPRALEQCAPYLRDGQLLVLRSTVYPGVTAQVERMIARLGRDVDVAFCPERIAEGQAMTELFTLPQIISSSTARGRRRAADLFSRLTPHMVELDPQEAELAKLFTNTWRYIKFAIANQLYMIANDHGLDYEKIRNALTEGYPRAADLPAAGFAAGPCLLKDTMQLAAFNNNNFTLGHAAMLVNEGLPLYVVARMEQVFDLPNSVVGVLGMAFKPGSDDPRYSLSYKLRRILQFKAKGVVCTDPYITDPSFSDLADVLAQSDVLIIGTPHPEYAELVTTKPVVDISNLLETGVVV